MSYINNSIIILVFFCFFSVFSQNNEGIIAIDTKNGGHDIKVGASGFNVRIADKSWSYLHPDFRKAVHELKPGWLRYFSGTMGDAFNSATGLYDIDYAMMFEDSKEYLKGYRFTKVKGPHRVFDLYQLLGEINGKLIITVNGFSETPEMTKELARFCKNNNIEVAAWQFCNEPYFYVPHRERHWWNDGFDYAVKMKPHADAIKEIFPDAFLALNNTWDGIWGFMKKINQYQKKHGAYWNVFSKHSYAPHTGKKETLEAAYKRGNTRLLEATSIQAMDEIEAYTWKDVPMVITEFGVWNKPLNGIYSSIYNIEYVIRQLQHTNTWYVGAHEVSSKYTPKENVNTQIETAFKTGIKLNTDSIPTDIKRELEGKAYEIFHEVTNHVDHVFNSNVINGFEVPGLKKSKETGFFTQAYRGINGYDYLVFTNRSSESKNFQITIDGDVLNKDLSVKFIAAESLETQNTDIQETLFENGKIYIPAYSVSIAKWKSKVVTKPLEPTIYNAKVTGSGIELTWGNIENVDAYTVIYGESPNDLSRRLNINDVSKTSISINKLAKGKTYYFRINAKNNQGSSEFSNMVVANIDTPETPEIFKTSRRDNTATVFWKSVSSTNGYKLKYVNAQTKKTEILDANNVHGFRVEGLDFDVPYQFSVAAYNGLGTGNFSKPVMLTLSNKVPLSPRNVSAVRKVNGKVSVTWIEQDSILPETAYNVYRGEVLHQYKKIASGIKTPFYEDETPEKDKTYYYTVKAETSAGESNFYPNSATLFEVEAEYSIKIINVVKQEDGYLFEVEFKNILLNGEYLFGLKLENISYLTVEEQLVNGNTLSSEKNIFSVFVHNSQLAKQSKYTIKAFINTNGKTLYSKLPNTTIITN